VSFVIFCASKKEQRANNGEPRVPGHEYFSNVFGIDFLNAWYFAALMNEIAASKYSFRCLSAYFPFFSPRIVVSFLFATYSKLIMEYASVWLWAAFIN